MRRTFDLVAASLAVTLFSPVLLLVAVAIKLESTGPVFFKQQRIGRHGKPFGVYKFRTMVPGAEQLGPGITVGNDPRVTRVGRFLRDAKLDELPQLLNVIRGEMSFVGPRPELERYVRLFEKDYRTILRIRPGLTDEASIAYRREAELLGEAKDPEALYVRKILPDKLRRSRAFAEHPSLAWEVWLILRTVVALALPPDVTRL